jgi:hypothetical protein
MKRILLIMAVCILGMSAVKAQQKVVLTYTDISLYNGQIVQQDVVGGEPSYYHWKTISGHISFFNVSAYEANATGSGSFVFQYYAVYPSGLIMDVTWSGSFKNTAGNNNGNGGHNGSGDDQDNACPDL